jgi:hypothetical protein
MRLIRNPNPGGRRRTFLYCGPRQFYNVVSGGLGGILTCVYRKYKDEKNSESAESLLDSDWSFCSSISDQDESGTYLLCLSAHGKRLYFKETRHREMMKLKSRSISLGKLLEMISAGELKSASTPPGGPLEIDPAGGLLGNMKEVLAWILSEAVWQYYTSPWMLEPWNKENVHFLFERRLYEGHDVTVIFVNEPFLSVSISPDKYVVENTQAGSRPEGSTKSGTKRRSPKFGHLHHIPKLLSLGVMLLEIHLGRSMESLRSDRKWSQYCPEGKPNLNTNYNICKDYIKKPGFFDKTSDDLEALIKNCIQPKDKFMPYLGNEERIRKELYHLVEPLATHITRRKPHKVPPLILQRSPLPTHSPPTPGRTIVQMYTSLQVYSSPRYLQSLARIRRQRQSGFA